MNKIIHYCWFGRGKKGKLFEKCLKSWKKYFPDYEIREWNEDNFNIYAHNYTKRAYEEKKYAFLSDYARLQIIYENGGIYFDTDVEVIRRIDDKILNSGYLAEEKAGIINTGLGFAAAPKNKAIKVMLDDYNNESGDYIPCPIKNTNALKDKGYIIKSFDSIEGLTIYPPEFFCGYDVDNNQKDVTKNTYTLHHYNGSWLSTNEKVIIHIRRMVSKVIGKKTYEILRKIKNKWRRKS